MAEDINNPITSLHEDWEPHSGGEVEDFIKSRLLESVGTLYRSPQPEEDGNIYLYSFNSRADRDNWLADPENQGDLVRDRIILPQGGGQQSASYSCQLFTDQPATIISTDNRVEIGVRFTSQEYNPITQTAYDTGEGGELTIQASLNGTSWTTAATLPLDSVPAGSESFRRIDITPYLVQGTQQVRLMVRGDSTGVATPTKRFTVTLTEVKVTNATAWERPVTGTVMSLQYYVTGAVAKTLHILVDGTREITRPLGATVFVETPLQTDFLQSDYSDIFTHGVHSIEAWVSIDGTDKRSDSVTMQMMIALDSSDTTPRILTGDTADKVANWTTARLTDYALYNPSGEPMDVSVTLENYDGTQSYLEYAETLTPGTRHTLESAVEIDEEATALNAYLRFRSGTTKLHDDIGISVDNSENFAPTAGADFVFNPRANGGATHSRIYNAASGQEVTSEWSGFSGSRADGTTTDDDGMRCLRVLAGQQLTVGYEPMSALMASTLNSTTIEFDLAVRNVLDEDAPLLAIAQTLATDNQPHGIEIRGLEIAALTRNCRTRADQNAKFSENTRTHVAVNILSGINGSARNYVRVFVNGVIYREFRYETNDSFVPASGSGGIRIGGTGADIDIYGMRVYKKALSAQDILRDYIATLPTAERKRSERERNDILDDNGQISFAKAREKYNTMVIRVAGGTVPSYLNPTAITAENVTIRLINAFGYTGEFGECGLKGQGTSSMSYWMWNFTITIKGQWTDSNGKVHDKSFSLGNGSPEATKLVAKRNWASSMQSHKMGCVNLYTDLWRRVTDGSEITNTPGFENCRVSVEQTPVMMFVEDSVTGVTRFYGLYTFGPGKGDKPTFGYDKKAFPDFMMLEGCDNGQPLTNHRIPWNEDITPDASGELLMYNGAKQWEIGMGSSEASLARFKEAFNMLYLCNPNIEPWPSTFAALEASESIDRTKLYWLTMDEGDHHRYDLVRYDALTGRIVNAGIAKLGEGEYERLNLAEQTGFTPASNIWETVNRQFKAERVRIFREKAPLYFDIKDLNFSKCFQLMCGASDNWAKNTYLYLCTATGKIRFFIDDNDTIFALDNVGRDRKPYYVEEHDKDETGAYYWNAEKAALWNLSELAYADEQRAMMYDILSAMADLGGSVEGCFEKYFFSTQEYFPAVAYNETARIGYEAADAAMLAGQYATNTPPLAQSLGSQLEAERQWIRRRIVYISSYAGHGMFAMNGAGALQFRSIVKRNGSNPSYSFRLTPHIWMYPAVSNGSSTIRGPRTKAGEVCEMPVITSDGNTNIQIHGIDWIRGVGEFSGHPVGEALSLTGARLTEFSASGDSSMEFRPTSITLACPNLRRLDLKGCSTLRGAINLEGHRRVREIIASGTSASAVTAGNPAVVESLRLPATITALDLTGYTALTNSALDTGTLEHLEKLTIAGSPNLNAQTIVTTALTQSTALTSVSLADIEFSGFSAANLEKLVDIAGYSTITGAIALGERENLSFALKQKCLAAWGNIDSADNPLRVSYTVRPVEIIRISGAGYYGEPGDYQLRVTSDDPYANDFTRIEWSMSANSYAEIDTLAGRVRVSRVGSEDLAPTAEVSVTVHKSDGTSVSKTTTVGFYERTAKVGDYVYADGSFSDILEIEKCPIGVCFYTNPENRAERLMVALKAIRNDMWGLGEEFTSMKLENRPEYSVIDVPTLDNIAEFGTAEESITEDTYRDESQSGDADGFRIFQSHQGASHIGFIPLDSDILFHREGERLPYGMVNTLKIIQHRNILLTDPSVNQPLPTSMSDLLEQLNRIVAENGNENKYRQYYYPAASLCNLYEPIVTNGQPLADRFKAGNWFLPSAGEYARIHWESPSFQKAVDAGIMVACSDAHHTSTERTSTDMWVFNNGKIYSVWPNRCKGHSYGVRAACAF